MDSAVRAMEVLTAGVEGETAQKTRLPTKWQPLYKNSRYGWCFDCLFYEPRAECGVDIDYIEPAYLGMLIDQGHEVRVKCTELCTALRQHIRVARGQM